MSNFYYHLLKVEGRRDKVIPCYPINTLKPSNPHKASYLNRNLSPQAVPGQIPLAKGQ